MATSRSGGPGDDPNDYYYASRRADPSDRSAGRYGGPNGDRFFDPNDPNGGSAR
jgi:hypothetical protein